jgi:phospholipid/cholesterol/gamma-HCH transport system permease protein
MAVDLERREPWMIRVTGQLSEQTGQELLSMVNIVAQAGRKEVEIEMSGVDSADSAGAAFLARAREEAGRAGIAVNVRGARGVAAEFIHLFEKSLRQSRVRPPRKGGFFEGVGGWFFGVVLEAKSLFNLLVDSIYWTFVAPFERRGVRWGAVWDEMHERGVRAVLIVYVVNLLLGFTMSLLAANQLSQFGASIFVADLIAIGFTRELAALMTAIVVSARSGSAITAELATMTVQEEVDALKSMGFNTAQFLITPKIIAMVICMPALTIIAMFAGIEAGFLLGVFSLGISPAAWISRTIIGLHANNIFLGLGKSVCYAVVIVVVGCHNGLRVTGGARGVGVATTRSVVMDVFFIIVVAAIFSIITG